MLTDEEIQSVYSEFLDVKGSAMEFARRIERAVLAKAGEQEPKFYKEKGVLEIISAQEYRELISIGSIMPEEFDPLYAHPLPAQAIPEKMRDIPSPKNPSAGERAYVWISQQQYVKGWNDCIDAMLSASPKP